MTLSTAKIIKGQQQMNGGRALVEWWQGKTKVFIEKKLSKGPFIHHKSKIHWPGTEPKASTMTGQKLTHSAMAQTCGFYGELSRVTTNHIPQNWMQMDWPRISRNPPDSANSLSNSNTEQRILLQQNSTVTENCY